MIAGDFATVTELNARARADRVLEGSVSDEGLLIADGQTAGVGDEVVTRQNNRLITTGRTWVKNGDRWIVTATNPDGSHGVAPCERERRGLAPRRLRRPARRARLRHDRVSQSGSDDRYRPLPRGSRRRREKCSTSQQQGVASPTACMSNLGNCIRRVANPLFTCLQTRGVSRTARPLAPPEQGSLWSASV